MSQRVGPGWPAPRNPGVRANRPTIRGDVGNLGVIKYQRLLVYPGFPSFPPSKWE
jgi:hypothetical protein